MRARSARGFVALAVFAVVIMTTAGIADAAPANQQQPVPVTSGDVDLGGFEILPPIVLPAPLPLVLTDLHFTAKAKWSGDLTTNVTWDSDDVRQGKDLDVGRTATPSGKIDVSWQIASDEKLTQIVSRGTATAADAFAGDERGDPRARAAVEAWIDYLAIGLANLVTVLTPDRIVLGGGVAAASTRIIDPLRERLAAHVRLTDPDHVQIVCAALGTRAGAIGAALRGLDA